MAKGDKKATKPKYKASDPEVFKASYNSVVPFYGELCKGESVEMDVNNKHVKNWLFNNIIKEV